MKRLALAIILGGWGCGAAHALDFSKLPALTQDSISITNELDQTIQLSVRGNLCPAVRVELSKDETRMLTCGTSTSFTLEFVVIDGSGARKVKSITVPAGAHYRSGGVDWSDRTPTFVDIRSR